MATKTRNIELLDELAMEGKEVRFLKGGEEVQGTVVSASIRDGLLLRVPGGEQKRFRLEHMSDFAFL